ncbi:MAG TPA: peptide-methionine (R)-S-oxide reductase MsrB [Granulicella sp.]
MFEFPQDQPSDTSDTHRMTRRAVLLGGSVAALGLFVARRAFMREATVEAKDKPHGAPGHVTIVNFSDDGVSQGKQTVDKVVKSDAEWREQLGANSFNITRRAGTEMPFTGVTWKEHGKGIYRCICCDTALFSSKTKFESGTGWPSFWEPLARENVSSVEDGSLGMDRTEVRCARCDGHLGHVFDDGPQPTGLRYCMNSASMKFVKATA